MIRIQQLVSIITPCYNGEEFLNNYFESILAQTYPYLELIFVNDGSNDDTERIALSYAEKLKKRGIIFKYIYQKNGGQAKAMNTAFEHMHGEYMVWPDSDDLLDASSIEKRVKFLEENAEFSFVRSNGYFFEYDTKEKLYRISDLENRFNEDIFLDLVLEKTFCCCGCYMIRTSILEEFYPDLKIYESSAGQNWQILIPIASKYKCGFVDEDLYMIAVRHDSHSRQKRTVTELIARYTELRKILEIAIGLSRRCDRDYEYILDVKYSKIYMRIYLEHRQFDLAKIEYKKLKSINEISKEDYFLYVKNLYPFRFKVLQGYILIGRIINKIKRMIDDIWKKGTSK